MGNLWAGTGAHNAITPTITPIEMGRITVGGLRGGMLAAGRESGSREVAIEARKLRVDEGPPD